MNLIHESHKENLKLKENVYYLVLEDAVASLYFDEDEKRIKIDIEMTPKEKTFVYFSKGVSVEDLI